MIVHLPSDLHLAHDSVQLFDYRLLETMVKVKINLQQNVFIFLVDGTKEIVTHHTSVFIDDQQFLLIGGGNCIVTEKPAPNRGYRCILLFFSDAVLLEFLEKHKIPALSGNAEKPYFASQYDAYTQTFVDGLKQILRYEPAMQASILRPKLEEILVYLVHQKGREVLLPFFNKYQNDEARNFKNVIESNTLNNLNIQELAFLCNMSVSTFKREFEKHYQSSPIKWFLEKRLEHAAFLLVTKRLRPSDIFTESGFESLSSFTQAFKKHFGITPKQYQQEKLSF